MEKCRFISLNGVPGALFSLELMSFQGGEWRQKTRPPGYGRHMWIWIYRRFPNDLAEV